MGEIADLIQVLGSLGTITLTSSGDTEVIPPGASADSLPGPWKEANVTESPDRVSSLFGFEMVNFDFTIRWSYNGQYIRGFHVTASGFADKTCTVQVRVTTPAKTLSNDDGLAELTYEIVVVVAVSLAGNKQTTYRGKVFGNGGGMSLL